MDRKGPSYFKNAQLRCVFVLCVFKGMYLRALFSGEFFYP